MSTTSDRAKVAHLLRATGFGVHRDQLDYWSYHGPQAALDWIVQDQGVPMPPSGTGGLGLHTVTNCAPGTPREDYPLANWWFNQMLTPEARLHEKMCFFWHSHFASNQYSTDAEDIVQQHRTIRQHALGNFRDFAVAMIQDPAMLKWLNGDTSKKDSANENLAREFMELFTLGTDPYQGTARYSETDVREAARALTGVRLTGTNGCPNVNEVWIDSGEQDNGSKTVLGTSGNLGPVDIANIVCDQPGTADFIARRVHLYLVGTEASDSHAAQLATTFRNDNLNLRTLVTAILGSASFEAGYNSRARWPVVWCAAVHVALRAPAEIPGDQIDNTLGQEIGAPKLVNGWKLDNRWIEPAACAKKAQWLVQRLEWGIGSSVADGALDLDVSFMTSPAEVLDQCGVIEPSASTLSAVTTCWNQGWDDRQKAIFALRAAVMSPEFQMI